MNDKFKITKKVMQLEGGGDTRCYWCARNNP